MQFYTHLYRSLIHPNVCSDVNGEYMGADSQRIRQPENSIPLSVIGIRIVRRLL